MGSSNKGKWYNFLIGRIDQAIESEHYFEAIFIEYMLIDDRIKSLAKLAEIELTVKDKPKMVGRLINDLKRAKKRQTVPEWKQLDCGIPLAPRDFLESIKKENYPIEKVNKCLHAPRQIINAEKSTKKGRYVSEYGSPDESLLNQIKAWTKKRNYWMHAAANEALTVKDYKSTITPLAIDGAVFSRELCDKTTHIKRGIDKERRKKAKAKKEQLINESNPQKA